jgi:O-methyltransferase
MAGSISDRICIDGDEGVLIQEDAMADEADPRDGLTRLADLITPMAVRVAATLRVADHIAMGPRTAAQLAQAVSADPDALDRVLRHLTSVGVLTRDEAGGYGLTPLGDALRDDHPEGLRARLDVGGAIGRADLSFVQLLHAVRTGEPAFPLQFGRPFWDDLASDPGRSASFDVQMGVDVAAWAPAILSAYDWGSLGHVVDVGGGGGTLLISLLRKYPALRGTVVDLPRPAETARKALAAAGLTDRATLVSGSFFDPLPPDAGGYLLSAIIHNWPDQPARDILRRCAKAAGAGGLVFIVEKTGAESESLRTARDLRALAYFGARERSVDDLAALAADSGLSLVAVHAAGTLSVIELSPAG